MFDDVTKEPQDMFSEIDATAPQVAAPTMRTASEESAPVAVSAPVPDMPMASSPSVGLNDRTADRAAVRRSFPWKVIVFVVILLVVIGLAFVLAMRILKSRSTIVPSGTVVTPTTQTNSPTPTSATPAPTTPEPVPAVAATSPTTTSGIDPNIDSDKDGLSDIQEAQLGTDPRNPDTDSDGLTDSEEVKVYHTNPLNPDTDGDGFKDGAEVAKGYNPNGPGKLLVIPTVK